MKKLLILFLCIFLLFSCSLFGTTYGPYHHAAYVYGVQEVANLNGRLFCIINNHFCELRDETFIKMDLDINGILGKVQAYNGKLYVSDSSGVNIFNEKLEKEENINIGAGSFFVDDDYIYYVSIKSDSYHDLYAYDLESRKSTLLATKLVNDIYQFNNKLIYVNDAFNIFDVTSDLNLTTFFFEVLSNDKIKTGGYTNPSFYAKESTGKIYWENDKLVVNYNEEFYEYELNGVNVIYGTIHTQENNVIFATYEYLEHDYCDNYLDCICHFGTNYIWNFNVETKSITKIKEFDEGIYLISFSETNYCYYKDGKVYRNNCEIKEVDKIEPYGKYTQIGNESIINYHARVSDTYFYDDGENIYHTYYDYKDAIKNQY